MQKWEYCHLEYIYDIKSADVSIQFYHPTEYSDLARLYDIDEQDKAAEAELGNLYQKGESDTAWLVAKSNAENRYSKVIARLGLDGWEMVQVVHTTHSTYLDPTQSDDFYEQRDYWFKRPLAE